MEAVIGDCFVIPPSATRFRGREAGRIPRNDSFLSEYITDCSMIALVGKD